MATSSCCGYVDELTTEPSLLLHCEHGTGCRRSWNCCGRRSRFVVIWKHFPLPFCLRIPGYGSTLWCALGLLVGGPNASTLVNSYSYSQVTALEERAVDQRIGATAMVGMSYIRIKEETSEALYRGRKLRAENNSWRKYSYTLLS